ncbi:MAG TPA: aspartate carbamoyltransferase, partial [Candidatus Polarisedimenticolaceae bacterium]|nr:aspartate carbamoyltransferase [Candidatus Polarisedimenticolaceae bacterium]
MKHVLTADQFTPKDLGILFGQADTMRELLAGKDTRLELANRHRGQQICTLFYEPSTRTRFSFESGALKLGMGVVSTENAGEFSSASKGETITDTMQMLNGYKFAAVIIRHPQTGIVAQAAKASQAPVVNAGDGKGDHPTQSLLDLYTIHRHFKRLDKLKVVMGGDLQNGRTVRSLAKLLSKYPGNHITFVSLPELRMDDDVKELLRSSGTTFEETDTVEKAFADADVVYWTRLQKERLESSGNLSDGGFIINAQSLQALPKQAIIMHPLPRVDEIAVEVDDDPRAKYFEQAGNGLYVRMALLDH